MAENAITSAPRAPATMGRSFTRSDTSGALIGSGGRGRGRTAMVPAGGPEHSALDDGRLLRRLADVLDDPRRVRRGWHRHLAGRPAGGGRIARGLHRPHHETARMRPLEEQRILITGSTDGLGRHVAAELAGRGAGVLMHGRDPSKVGEVAREVGAEAGLVADLADLAQVRRLAEEAGELDTLVNNAGVIEPERRESADGYELTLAVNH